jgi:lipid A 3-O-deacylase
MTSRLAPLALFSVIFCIAAAPTLAADADKDRVITLTSENDLYAARNRDRHYTNGIRLGWMSGQDTEWASWVGSWMPLPVAADHYRIGFALGHNLYTPQNKSADGPILDDRPYAAWFYGAARLEAESSDHLDTVELDLGVVGPWALGKQVQNDWHSLIGARSASGWSNQIKNEPGINVEYDHFWRIPLGSRTADARFELIPNATASVGNVFTYAGTGAVLRFGQELQADFGPPRIQPGLPGSASFHRVDSVGWYLFIGAQGRLVARNITLDGNTFEDSASVHKKPLVGDFQAGAALLFWRARLAYTHVLRTKEFDGQKNPDYLGSLSLSVAF